MNITKKVKEFIELNADAEKAAFARKLIPTQLPINGVPTKLVEDFAKKLAKEGEPWEEIPLDSHDGVCIAGFYLAAAKWSPAEKVEKLERLLPAFDNWATVDCVTCRLKRMESEQAYFESLLFRDNPFQKRVGIIWLMRFALSKDVSSTLQKIMATIDENYYVKMAKAWTLAEAALHDFDYTKQVIEQEKDEFIRNKAISKCCDSYRITPEQKTILKTLLKSDK